jgi:hypothetical protein
MYDNAAHYWPQLVASSNLHPLFQHMAGAVNPLRNSSDLAMPVKRMKSCRAFS